MASIHQLEYILALDQYKHFAKAAEHCRITQPTLSMQVQKLEEELGVVLFDRSKKPLVVTELGKSIVLQARVVVQEFKKIESLSKNLQTVLGGDLYLGVIPTLSSYLIPLFLKGFAKAYPQMRLHIKELQTHQIVSALDRDELDAALLVTPLEEARIQEEVLFYEHFFCYLPKGHELLKRQSIELDDLKGEQPWLLTEGHCFRNQMLKICEIPKQGSYQNIIFESGSFETLKKLVDENGGYTILPYLALTQSKGGIHPQVVPFKKPYPSREVSLVLRRSDSKKHHLEALKETILKFVPQELKNLRQPNANLPFQNYLYFLYQHKMIELLNLKPIFQLYRRDQQEANFTSTPYNALLQNYLNIYPELSHLYAQKEHQLFRTLADNIQRLAKTMQRKNTLSHQLKMSPLTGELFPTLSPLNELIDL
jgi:LysR family hydrogen peroxide-inducible transcriptional activator